MLQNLRPETETACAAIQLQTIEVYHSVACLQQGIDTDGGYFERLRLRKTRQQCTNICPLYLLIYGGVSVYACFWDGLYKLSWQHTYVYKLLPYSAA